MQKVFGSFSGAIGTTHSWVDILTTLARVLGWVGGVVGVVIAGVAGTVAQVLTDIGALWTWIRELIESVMGYAVKGLALLPAGVRAQLGIPDNAAAAVDTPTLAAPRAVPNAAGYGRNVRQNAVVNVNVHAPGATPETAQAIAQGVAARVPGATTEAFEGMAAEIGAH
jgi:hypothetical protein